MNDTCENCGRLPTINGHHETIMLLGTGGFRHPICDDRWDTPDNWLVDEKGVSPDDA
jgi:hypothetical protein